MDVIHAIRVQQIDKDGNVKVFPSVQEVQKLFSVSRRTLTEAIDHDIVLRGYKWNWVQE